MKLIVEGPDGSGKTTVIERLGFTRRHLKSLRGGLGGSTAEGWGGTDLAPIAYIRQLIESPDETAFDRFYLSELVYGPILRGQAAIRDAEAEVVRQVASMMNIYTVLCLPSFEMTLKNVMEPGRDRPEYQTPEFLREAYEQWRRIVAYRTEDVIVFDFERDSVERLAQLLEQLQRNHPPLGVMW